jgi:AraC-like DNA-binding protein
MVKEKPYLNFNFNLSMLSNLSGYPPHTISEVLNGLFNQNFNDYVNNYRLEEFKTLAGKKENKYKTILSLAYDSGFKSKATFNNVFKKFTGKTPSQFLREIEQNKTAP